MKEKNKSAKSNLIAVFKVLSIFIVISLINSCANDVNNEILSETEVNKNESNQKELTKEEEETDKKDKTNTQTQSVQTSTKQENDYNKEKVKNIIDSRFQEIIKALHNKDMEVFSRYVHPLKGIRFSKNGIVEEEDLILNTDQIKKLFKDNKLYTWNYFNDGSDIFPYEAKGIDYFNKYIYFNKSSDLKIGYNTEPKVDTYYPLLPKGHIDFYPNSIYTEVYLQNNYPEMNDWQVRRFIFEEYNDEWYLVCLINYMWTP